MKPPTSTPPKETLPDSDAARREPLVREPAAGERRSTPVAGFFLIFAGLALMLLSGVLAPWEDASAGTPPAGGSAVVSGSDGNDDLYGGSGREVILGGEGDDFIEAKDGARDFVSCGPGDDVASVDGADRVAGDCETVYGD